MATAARVPDSSSNDNTPKRLRFSQDIIGLTSFLEMFKPLWKVFLSIADIIGSTTHTREFEGKKRQLVKYSAEAFEKKESGPMSQTSQTIAFGMRLFREIEEFLEAWVDSGTANLRFDAVCTQIEKLSKQVWEERKENILTAREAFTKAADGEDLDSAVLLCAEVERLLKASLTRAQSFAQNDLVLKEHRRQAEKEANAAKRGKRLLEDL